MLAGWLAHGRRRVLVPFADKQSHLLGCLALLLFATALAALARVWVFPGPYTSALPRPFDSAQWKAGSGEESRCAMLADLRYRIGIVGRTRAELTDWLGEPDGGGVDPASSSWLLCPSFIDIWVLRVRWREGHAVAAAVHDT